MEEFDFDTKKFWGKNALPLAIFTLLGIIFVVYTVQRWVYAYQVEGQWVVFDSQDHMSGENNPDGFRLDVPKGWHSAAYDNGGGKNFKHARAGFDEPYFLTTPDTYLTIWWKRVDESWTNEDVRDWYIKEIGFGYNRDLLESQRDSFRNMTVGAGDYQALSQVFMETRDSGRRLVIFIVDDEAFVLDFEVNSFKEFAKTIGRMLGTFEVYE